MEKINSSEVYHTLITIWMTKSFNSPWSYVSVVIEWDSKELFEKYKWSLQQCPKFMHAFSRKCKMQTIELLRWTVEPIVPDSRARVIYLSETDFPLCFIGRSSYWEKSK